MKNKCRRCGLCCRLFLINLSRTEYQSGKYKTVFEKFGTTEKFLKARNYGANIISQNKDGSCIYLKNHSCRIHKSRPAVCRKFFCTSKSRGFKNMIRLIEEERAAIKIKATR